MIGIAVMMIGWFAWRGWIEPPWKKRRRRL
jgi:hypothetical protein